MRNTLLAVLVIAACQGATAYANPAWPAPQSANDAQAETILQGKVSDASGAVIVGASVTAVGTDGSKVVGVVGADGSYILRGLNAGSYAITISSPGFADKKLPSVTINAGIENALDVQMAAAGESSSVEVVGASANAVELEHAELSGTITQQDIVTMGLNGRNFSQAIAITPGVSNQTQQDEAKVGVVGSAKYSVNGGRVEYNNFDIDGSDVLNTGIAASRGHTTLSVYPSLDAIQELKVLTSNYGAQYGRSASGTVVVTTKSGDQRFHGNAYDFTRNEIFNARGFKDPPGSAPLYRRQDFGATFGGPLYLPNHYNTNKTKSFFFFSEEFRLERSPFSVTQAVPSLQEREGNFLDVCGSSGTGANCPQYNLGNSNSTSMNIDPNARAILNTGIIPVATSSTGCNYSLVVAPNDSDPSTWPCYNQTVSTDTYWREELFRIDHNVNPNVKASFRYIHDNWDTISPTPQWQYGGSASSFPTVMNRFTGPGLNIIGHLVTMKASTSLVNDYSVALTTQHITLKDIPGPGMNLTRPAQLDNACGNLVSSCGVGYIFQGSGGKIPGLNFGGANAAYGGPGFLVDTSYMPWRNANPTISIRDDMSKQVGKHMFQMGLLFVDAQQSELSSATGANTGNVQGMISFNNNRILNNNTTGNAFADFLLENTEYNSNLTKPNVGGAQGGVVSYQQDSGQQVYSNRYEMIEPYLQDEWKVTRRFNLVLGLRVSLFGNWTPNGNKVYNFVPSRFDSTMASQITVDSKYGYIKDTSSGAAILASATSPDQRTINGLTLCGAGNTPASCMSSHYFNPSPRIGFAWDTTGRGNTSIRAGYGIFFEHGTGDEANSGSLTGSAPLVQSMTQNAPLSNAFRMECIGGRAVGCSATVPAGAAFPMDVTAIPTKTQWPYVQQWSLSTQQQFGKSTVATLAYVGSKGTRLVTVSQLNQFDPVTSGNNYFGTHEPLIYGASNYAVGQPSNAAGCPQAGSIPWEFTTGTGYEYFQDNPAFRNLLIACSTGVNANSMRRYNGYGRIFSLQNRANSAYHAAQFTVHHVRGPVNLGLSYSFSHSIDEASDRFESSLGNSLDPRANRASSDFDQRNILNLNYTIKTHFDRVVRMFADHAACADDDEYCRDEHPWGSAQLSSRAVKFLKDWEVSGLTIYQNGSPFTVLNGGSPTVSSLDNAGVANGLGAGSYPDHIFGTGHCNTFSGDSSSSFVVGPVLGNRCQFLAPRGLTFGNSGRNFLNNPARTNWDIALHRYFSLPHESNFEVRAEVFNALNHTQYRIYNPELGNTASNTISCYGDALNNYSAGANSCDPGNAFLHPVDAHRPRTMQFGVKLAF